MKKTFIILATSSLLVSCAVQPMYYWGDYSKSYYKTVETPGQQSTDTRLASLENIIKKTEKSSTKKIGPGVYAEYGYMLIELGQVEKGNIYLQKEKEKFPESSNTIVDFITPKSK